MKPVSHFSLIAVAVLLFACGSTQKQSVRATGIVALNSHQQELVRGGISRFNLLLEQEHISTDEADNNAHNEIEFKVESQQMLNDIEALPGNGMRNGYAEGRANKCIISLSERLFLAKNEEILLSVIIHELGHCAGLAHKDTGGKIMSPSPISFSLYSPEVLAEYKADLQGVLGLANGDH